MASVGQPISGVRLNGLDDNRAGPPVPQPSSAEIDSGKEIDLEDLATAEDDELDEVSTHVVVQGKKIHKARVLREWYKYSAKPNSTDRLKRVAQIARYSATTPSSNTIIDHDSVFGGPILSINDPVATLVSVNDNVFLAIAQVTSLKKGNHRIDSIDLSLLRENSVSVGVQILQLVPKEHDESVDATDWRWNQNFEASFVTPGRFIHPINPTTTTTFPPSYLFRSDELRSIAATAFDLMDPGDAALLPTVKQTPSFPYRSTENEACFVCEKDGHELDNNTSHFYCDYCPKQPNINWKSAPEVIGHMAAHLLHDISVPKDVPRCGFCLKPDPTCRCAFRGKKESPQLDAVKTIGCRVFGKDGFIKLFKYQYAAKSSKRSPCSNVPIPCPVDPDGCAPVWKYSLQAHLHRNHSVDPEQYKEYYQLSKLERQGMRDLWNNRHNSKPKKTLETAKSLQISAAHSSRLAGTEGGKQKKRSGVNASDDSDLSDSGDESEESEDERNGDPDNDDDENADDDVEGHEDQEEDGQADTSERDEGDDEMQVEDTEARMSNEDGGEVSGEGRAMESTAENEQHAAPTPPPAETPPRVNKRKTRGVTSRYQEMFNVCSCNEKISEEEIKSGKNVIKCDSESCETRHYHLSCMELPFPPDGWLCVNCEDVANATSTRHPKKRRRT
ncbi:hypothetical protein SISSUDRAFT_1132976 [Sistotremastrum suecicum HHB10207 ss-3]|uniref:Zinc finger PHD-type domain-containing protein n=1 Tax=Sistotremastrum suecicum HHB10207 ss-3 TaxID=1314776 RepID=A0A165Y169_9AGAM|nr:hypothetical protein SISSUDRAFT_1132976 [Sistotremastrum suecicum HHB10207 ss-3]